MKKSTTVTVITPLKLYCNLFGHNYKVTKQVTHYVKEYTCSCCKQEFTTNSNGYLTELTPIFKDINNALAKMYLNKMAKLRSQRLNTSAA